MDKIRKNAALVLVWLVLFAVIYVRPLPFEEAMQGFYDAPIVKCVATYHEQEAGADGKPVYTTVTKEFEVGSADYETLLEKISTERYRQQLAAFFSGGSRTSYSIPYPYAEITFHQEGKIYDYQLYNKYLVAGPKGEHRDFTPEDGGKFQAEMILFVRDYGETVSVDVQDYSQTG